ncbi:MAG: hypothetical protein K2Q14_03760 [Gammaproteobacteria bacterium]|nr:hypothetical protein [Gammaproteobacteria bacterium]MBY0544648.1 hypothetical protein [Gammaproteobacteria bacterium]
MKMFVQKRRQKIRGIGLLELMLTLSLLAVMIMVAVEYYSSANTEQEATTVVNSYSTIKSAVENYLADNPTAGVPTMALLVQNGYLPSVYNTSLNMWGGTITVTTSGNAAFAVAQTAIPKSVCAMAYGQIAATLNNNLGECVVVSAGGARKGALSCPTGKAKGTATLCSASSTITVNYMQ